jgi:glucose-6-phosphate isomerase
MPVFKQLLAGAAEADSHFLHTPLGDNIPVIMGLLAVWYRNFWQCESQVVLPYAQDLQLLPAFLQQLEMESLGKSVDRDGHALAHRSGPVIWGSAGTNGQHSFHQLLHQGTTMIPADFIAVASSHNPQDLKQNQHLLANCLAQSRALMLGKSFDEALEENIRKGMEPGHARQLAQHRQVQGNRPSSTFILQALNPHSLGILLAFYEHKVFVQSVIWNLNAFDQWGVEIGKQLSEPMFEALCGDQLAASALDQSSQHIIQHIHALSGTLKLS